MATTNKSLCVGSQIAAAASAYYTAPANTSTIVKKLTITNTSAMAVAVTLYLVPAGGQPGAANTITSAKSLAPGTTYEAYECENHLLAPGDSLQALAGAAGALSLKASGIEIV